MRPLKNFLLLFALATAHTAFSQKIESISFNLYTDSLKKGFYNYINVDGKTPDGKWVPLMAQDIIFTSNAGRFEGNDIFIDSTYMADSVKIKAELRSNPAIWKEITIYIRKRGFTEVLKTDEEIIGDMKKEKVKVKTKTKG